MKDKHFNQTVKRRAEFIKPPNSLKKKVGFGGLSEDVLQKAQTVLDTTTYDFVPLAEEYLFLIEEALVDLPQRAGDPEEAIASVLFPAMQLKANGGMLGYPVVTTIGDTLIRFLEVIETLDQDAINIVRVFHASMKIIIAKKMKGSGGKDGSRLAKELNDACERYFKKRPPIER